jgi:hypothetical protein
MAQRKQFLLRIDPELWEDLESWAKDELRSVNGQIEYVLRDAVKRRRGPRRASGPDDDAGGRTAADASGSEG